MNVLLTMLLVAGCGVEPGSEFTAAPGMAKSEEMFVVPPSDAPASARMNGMSPAEAKGGEAGQAAADAPPLVPRKIIYNAHVSLVVKSIGELTDELMKLVKDSGGYVSSSDVSSQTRAQRTATWTLRVPVERFETFMSALTRVGEVQQNRVDSQDVTQEFYDIEARISNKQKEESRLQKHLEESTGRLEDILAVEREITRVRGEIEQMQGRLRYLANVSSLSTVTITAIELQDYKPPVEPSLAENVRRTFERSLSNLQRFLEGILLAGVGLAPWIPVVLVLAIPGVWIWRKLRGILIPGPRPS